jgi:Putative Actinobacterial Holin-X, holin superfamily III
MIEGLKEKIFKLLRIDNLMENLTGYAEARMELFKLEIREDVAKMLSKAMIYGILAIFGFLFLIFFSIGLAQFLNGFFSHPYIGSWIVAGGYGVAFLTLIVFRDSIDQAFEKRFLEFIKRKAK